MRLIFNIVFSCILLGGALGFWALMMNLWKPKRKWIGWSGYILLLVAFVLSVRYYFLHQVQLFGSPYYPLFNMLRTEAYGLLFGIFIAIPVLLVFSILYWLVNQISRNVPEEERTGRRAFFRTAATVVPLATVGGSSYAAFTGQSELVVNHESFGYTNLPPGLRDYKIVQISDIHLGASIDLNDLDDILQRVLLQKPNRVVITGDLIDRMAWLPELCERLTVFTKQIPDGVDYILGNHEYHHDVNKIINDLKEHTPMNVLINSNVQIMGGRQPVFMAGVAYDNERNKSIRERFIYKALSGIPEHAFVILLAHHPEFFEEAVEHKVPLTLSGHTHGGQIVLFGQPLVPIGTPYVKGRYVEQNSVCYVNNGTGHWFPIRVNCPREITVITFFEGRA